MRETVIEGPGIGPLRLPVIGQGTWTMGERPERRGQEIEALRAGFEQGMTLVDTAELYGAGGAERVVGEAMRDCRDAIFVVTKVWPSNARYDAVLRAVEGSLRRMGTDHVECVLLHWPTRSVPIGETMRAFEKVVKDGLSRCVGVSNFPMPALAAADAVSSPASPIGFHQVRYGLDERRAERGAIPDAQAHGRVLLAYSPLAHGRLRRSPGYGVLQELADRRGVSAERLALAWSVTRPNVVAIPKASRAEHVRDNAAAADLALTEEERSRLEAAFPTARGDLPVQLPPYDAFFRVAMWGLRRRFARNGEAASARA